MEIFSKELYWTFFKIWSIKILPFLISVPVYRLYWKVLKLLFSEHLATLSFSYFKLILFNIVVVIIIMWFKFLFYFYFLYNFLVYLLYVAVIAIICVLLYESTWLKGIICSFYWLLLCNKCTICVLFVLFLLRKVKY